MDGCPAQGYAFIDVLELANPHDQLHDVLDQEQRPHLKSLGIIECLSVAATIRAADAALKATHIDACKICLADGLGGKGYFVFTGELHDVEFGLATAIEATGVGLLAGSEVIARPHDDFLNML